MNREILRIALPAIVANITIPLLGLVDTAIAGHLAGATLIGAMAVASMVFNLIYWNFGFLRMGTSGLTAQAYGAGNHTAAATLLAQTSALAALIGIGIMALQVPLLWVTMRVIGASTEVESLASAYYRIVIWGAVPTLVMMSIKGWLLGMQDSRGAMEVSIVVNVLNIVASLVAAYPLGLGFEGIAYGTLAAQWLGLVYAAAIVLLRFRRIVRITPWRKALRFKGAGQLFRLNGNIFARSTLLMIVNLAVVAIGARSGDLILAVNALIQHLNTLYAYFLDGIAFAGEALVGKYVGRGNTERLRLCVRRLFLWGVILAVGFTLLYTFPQLIFSLLTDDPTVRAAAMDYRLWCALLPAAGLAAFVWDGVFIGLAYGRGMLIAVTAACALFFALYAILPPSMGNHRLWLAFVIYLAARGIVQTWLYRRKQLC